MQFALSDVPFFVFYFINKDLKKTVTISAKAVYSIRITEWNYVCQYIKHALTDNLVFYVLAMFIVMSINNSETDNPLDHMAFYTYDV